MAIPFERTPGAPDSRTSPLHRLEHALHPWVAFAIVPLFGFANAGVDVRGLGIDQLFAPLPLGIAAGLFLGKQIGIFGSVWLSVKLGIAGRLRGATWLQVYGVAMLRSEEHTSELQSLMRISYAVFCLKKKIL